MLEVEYGGTQWEWMEKIQDFEREKNDILCTIH
jgi:hypothetical protein